jgi:methionyl-tRNA formyltransferase
MDAGVDTGPILAQRSVGILPDETAGELTERLSGQGADLLVHTLRRLESGQISPQPQFDQGAVYAPKLTRSLAPIRWDRPVTVVHNQIRGLQPQPGATSFLADKLLKITGGQPFAFGTSPAAPGTILAVDREGIRVACGEGILLVTNLQCPGGRPLSVAQYIQGHEVTTGDLFHS